MKRESGRMNFIQEKEPSINIPSYKYNSAALYLHAEKKRLKKYVKHHLQQNMKQIVKFNAAYNRVSFGLFFFFTNSKYPALINDDQILLSASI